MPTRRDADGKTRRGVSNGNERGSNEARRRRRAWLLETYAADVKLIKVTFDDESVDYWVPPQTALTIMLIPGVVVAEDVSTARCYRCGCLLHEGTITVDRIIPGCHGGTYARTNIRPACGADNSSTGGALAAVKVGKVATPRRR